ncbi:MAG TPA: hypothetical protein VGH28_23225 [Polyangiaceae bacterium]|jgi:hypothetical protein
MRWGVTALLIIACGGQTGDDTASTGDAGKDASLVDGADGAADVTDANPSDDGGCPTPAAIGSFSPTPIHPPRVSHGACTSTQIDDAFKSCFPPTTCDSFKTANPTCAACLFSSSNDSTWGPTVTLESGSMQLNVSGCVAASTGDSSATSCAQLLDDVSQCSTAACDQQCPLTGPQSIGPREQCYGDAAKTVCSAYVANECAMDAGWVSTCITSGNNDPEAQFDSIAAVMCGQ